MKYKIIIKEVDETDKYKGDEVFLQVKEMTDADLQRVILAVNNIKAVEK